MTVMHKANADIRLMPVALREDVQPVPSSALSYIAADTQAQLVAGTGLSSLYSLGLFARDFSLDDDAVR